MSSDSVSPVGPAPPGATIAADAWPARLSLAIAALLAAGASAAVAAVYPVNDDETFWLNFIWQIGHGHVPERGYFGGMPGMWLLLAPAAWLPSSASQFLVGGRLAIASLFGASVWLAGRLVRARPAHVCLFGVIALWVMFRSEWFMFRRIYFEVFLLLVHLSLLVRISEARNKAIASGLAALPIGLACTMSPRMPFLLPIQPLFLFWALGRDRAVLRRALGGWGLGGLTAALPAVIYITLHGVWSEEWRWAVVFPTSLREFRLLNNLDSGTAWLCLWGAAGLAAVACERRLSPSQKKVFVVAWLVTTAFCVTNPIEGRHVRVHAHLLTAAIATMAPFVVMDRLGVRPVAQGMAGAAVLLLAVVLISAYAARGQSRERLAQLHRMHATQLAVLDWLDRVSEGEAVVAVDPHHPMVVPNATFLRGAWHYAYWLDNPLLRAGMQGFADEVLCRKPPFIAANPWPAATGGRDLIAWLQQHGNVDAGEASRLRALVGAEYVQVTFPGLSVRQVPSGVFVYGDAFWVRKDRFEAHPPPDPFQVEH